MKLESCFHLFSHALTTNHLLLNYYFWNTMGCLNYQRMLYSILEVFNIDGKLTKTTIREASNSHKMSKCVIINNSKFQYFWYPFFFKITYLDILRIMDQIGLLGVHIKTHHSWEFIRTLVHILFNNFNVYQTTTY